MAEVEAFKLKVPANKRSKDKVAIVGFTDHRVHAFALGDDFERWGINEMHRVPGCEWEKFDRWFEVHMRKDIDQDAQHIETMRAMNIPVYMQEKYPDIPASQAFPCEELRELSIRYFGRSYFTNSIAWQVAYAIKLGFKEIHVYGVDMAQDCLAPETRVLTSDLRWVRADEVTAGDDLLGFVEEPGAGTQAVAEEIRALEANGGTAVGTERKLRAARHWRVSKVIGRSIAARPSYRIHFEDGTTVVASAGHQWLAPDGQWARTDALIGGAHICRVMEPWSAGPSWGATVAVTKIEFVGEVETVGFTTSTATLVAEGLASHNSEYAEQRPCCEAWLGVAAGMGIATYIPATSDLLKCVGEYGFGEVGTEFSLKVHERTDWLHQQDNDFLTQVRAMDAEFPRIQARLAEEFKARKKAIHVEFMARIGALEVNAEYLANRAALEHEERRVVKAAKKDLKAKLAALEAEYRAKRGHLWDQRNQVAGAILDCNFWKRSWAVHAMKDRTFSPDRTKDPRIGLAPKDADMTGVSASKRILEGAAA